LKIKKFKVLCPCPDFFTTEGLQTADKLFCLKIKKLNQRKFDAEAGKYDGLLVRHNLLIKKDFIKQSRLKFIITPTTGLDHIDENAANMKKIKIISLRGHKRFLKKIPATAEFTFCLIFSLLRKTIYVINKKKTQLKSNNFIGTELNKKSLGIIGYGRIGKMVAQYGRAFGMKVKIYDPFLKIKNNIFKNYKTLKKILQASDIVTIHAPLNTKTKDLFNKKTLKFIKKSGYLINTSRGELINIHDLLSSLKNNKIAGAALDVIPNENKEQNCNLKKIYTYAKSNSNLILTPHVAGLAKESMSETEKYALGLFCKFYRQKNIL